MIKGLYTAAAGMMLNMAKQDVIANNIANVNSHGYKKDSTVARAFPEMLISRLKDKDSPRLIGSLGTGACIGGIYTDYTQGVFKKTDNPYDLAIDGEGFFVCLLPGGEEVFTRDGSFKINADKMLVNNQGYPVLDRNDQVIYIEGEDFTVDERGVISVEGEEIAQLKIVSFPDPNALEKRGDNTYTGANYDIDSNSRLRQGYVEDSNVNAVKEMVDLITVVRSYESLQKIIQAVDETVKTAIDQVGSV
ncbi:flagellar basal-body rod protein FlgG [Thermosyntropha lipolytica DSM 11003]|uniref:Flagellar basal-body rod protein FlgG n=1 Tax=Thermosyntropha lipolytica DSM 11003 TaxID=1123382 RepID=A0A1M5NSV7_9FIRM|nr:flagellar basal-body rod protein FlgF [Thermosyntropha lipolytica]SHG92590.1 flagellar basal-body rod protein FlgG [Thermosyntropha lipolytica DSM 11003]